MFAIFDEDKFLIPYLNLNIGNNIIDLVIDEPSCLTAFSCSEFRATINYELPAN